MSVPETVLVTGGSGMVGRCLAEAALDQGSSATGRQFVFLSSRDGDLTDYNAARRLFEACKPDHVIHLAAKVGGLYANLGDANGQFYDVNKRMNENVLALAYKHQVKRCLSCLSTCVFPDQIDYPIEEKMLHNGPPHASNLNYAMAKRHLDTLNMRYNSQMRADANLSGLFSAIIPTNIYGPHDNFHRDHSHVLPGLVARAFEACLDRRQADSKVILPVYGSGAPLRQFVYARDLARLILWSIDHFDDRDEPRLIVCADEEFSIAQVAGMVCEEMGRKFGLELEPQFDRTKSDGQFRKTASNRKLRRLNPAFQFTPLEVGLRETVDWFCDSYPRVRGL